MNISFKHILTFGAAILVMAACQKHEKPQGGEDIFIDDSPVEDEAKVVPITVDGQFPIVAWTGIDASDTARKFGPMKECGINVYLGWYDKLSDVMLALDNAEKAGVKCILRSDELFDDTEAAVAAMKDHPALLAYEIKDEPEVGDFSWLGKIVKRIQDLDPVHPCYINLYPNWAWGGMAPYYNRVNWFLDSVPVKFASFDYYPVMEIKGVRQLRPEWYKNLEDFRAVCADHNLPFWAFALALGHDLGEVVYPIPSVSELRLQMFSNLVYGATGFQYFTYWGIYQRGATNVYERVKTVNKELQALAPYFLGATIDDVRHLGRSIPTGTKPLEQMPEGVKSIRLEEGGAVVSMFSKDDAQYMAIVNSGLSKTISVEIEFSAENVKRIDHDGYMGAASDGTFSIAAGDITIFKLLTRTK